MVGCTAQRPTRVHQPAQRTAQRLAGRVEDRGVIKPGGARGRRWTTPALPGVESDVVVIAAGAQERGLVTPSAHHVETQDAVIEGDRPLEVADLEMDVADAGTALDRRVRVVLVLIHERLLR